MNRYFNVAEAVTEKLLPATHRQSSEATLACIALIALTVAGAATGSVQIGLPGGYALLLQFVPVLFAAATAIVLVNMFRVPIVSRPIFLLGLAYAGLAILSGALTIGLENDPIATPTFRASGFWHWLYSLSGLYYGLAALGYVALRRRELGLVTPSGRFLTLCILINAVAVAAAIACAVVFRFSPAPPQLVGATVSLIAVAVIFRFHHRTLIDSGLGLALLASALAVGLELLPQPSSSGTWYVGQALHLLSAVFVLVAAGRTLSEARSQIMHLTTSIGESQRILQRNALRLNGLWYVASHGIGDERERYQALLDTATAALRPGSSTFGYISHIEGDSIVIDSTYASALLPHEAAAAESTYFPTARMPLSTTIEHHLSAVDRSASWANFAALPAGGMAWEHLGWTRVIGSSLAVGSKRYFIVFGSLKGPDNDEYSEDDFTYVDVLAAFIAGRLLQEAQVERIRFQIEHDALTGLHTRTQFRLAIRKAIALGNPFAVAALDLDKFATINTEAGSLVADELLVEVASTIDQVDDDDIAARLGADEFGLLLSSRQNEQMTQARIAKYFDLFQASFATGLTQDQRRLDVTASMGIASFPQDGKTEQELMQSVNVALSAAKASGGDTMTAFSRSMEVIIDEQRTLAREIRTGLDRDEFTLEYQPTVSLATGKVHGAEALIRWNHPTRGRLAPDDFIPFAERNGLSVEIGRWVLDRALQDIMGIGTLPRDFRCFVNISAPGLEDDAVVANVRSSFARYPGAFEHFGIEVTEGAAMLNAERAILSLGALRRLGLRIAIDDFGTGYSSLSYLKRLPIDIIKLDRSFIMGLPHEIADVALTETLLSMASRFRLTSLAEGVETAAQAQWLTNHGCEFAQGYLYARSMPIDELANLLESDRMLAAAS